MPSIAAIRAEVEARLAKRVPGAVVQPGEHLRPWKPAIVTGIEAIDELTGGVPVGGITEIVAPARASAGQKTVQTRLLARATQNRICALIDASDSFDPGSAEATGVALARLLWVRCSGQGWKALEQAFKCADLLLQGSGGFGVIVIDLSGIAERWISKVPMTTWFRFSRVVERLETSLLFSTPCRVIASCAALTLTLTAGEARWRSMLTSPACVNVLDSPSHSRLLAGFDFTVESTGRRPARKSVQRAVPVPVHSKWA
jgi:hypothetical protein